MNYYSMIASEDTTSRYQAWSEYRDKLTNYIFRGVGEYCKKGSWIAIWGAGGCNDIDVRQLAKNYNLLLIDRDVEKLVQLRQELGLSEDICKVADVNFWSVLDEDYEMFEALLLDGASVDELVIFFEELLEKMSSPSDLTSYSVEASVVVGLVSQLNSRFVALLHLHRDALVSKGIYRDEDFLRVYKILEAMNEAAVERLYVSIRQITQKVIMTGYEIEAFSSQEDALIVKKDYKSLFGVNQNGEMFLSGREGMHIKIAGNTQWHQRLTKAIAMDAVEDACMCDVLCWNFTEDKNYLMLMVGLKIHKR